MIGGFVMRECDHCGGPYDPISSRWLCPWCMTKNSCCDGTPLPAREPARDDEEARDA